MGNIYIDLEEDTIYVWDSAIGEYVLQSWNKTIIESLQSSITNLQNSKLDKPTSTGDYYLSKIVVGGVPYYQYRTISLSDGQIPRSFGQYIAASVLYEDLSGRIGLDKTNPTEKLDVNGNIKADKFIPKYSTGTASFNKVEAINPDTNERSLKDFPTVQNNIYKNAQYNNINYCGYAPFGSAESSAVWTVTKITVAANGTATKQTFTNVTWSSVPF